MVVYMAMEPWPFGLSLVPLLAPLTNPGPYLLPSPLLHPLGKANADAARGPFGFENDPRRSTLTCENSVPGDGRSKHTGDTGRDSREYTHDHTAHCPPYPPPFYNLQLSGLLDSVHAPFTPLRLACRVL